MVQDADQDVGLTNIVDESEEEGEILQLVSFHVGDEEYAVDILNVQEIIRMVEITAVPNAPHYVEGVINLRGKVIPILDLRARFGLSAIEQSKETRIIVVDLENVIIGFIVDSVSEVLRLPESRIEPSPVTSKSGSAEFHKGVGRINGRLLVVLDLKQLIHQ